MADVEVSALATANMNDKPIFMQPASGDPDFNYSGDDIRVLAYMMFPNGGVFKDSEMKITPSSGRTINISSGHAIIQTQAHPYAGSYVVVATGDVPLTLPANGSGSTIIYRVLAQVVDKYYGASTYDWKYLAVESAPGGQPATAAALRSSGQNVVELGLVTVTNGLATITSSNISEASRELASGGTGWTNITTFYSGWTSYGSIYRPAGIRLDNSGTVHLDGMLKAASSGTDSGLNVFQIPIGFRPPYVQVVNTFAQRDGVRELARMDLHPDGHTTVFSPGGLDWRLATNDYISLSNITYSIIP